MLIKLQLLKIVFRAIVLRCALNVRRVKERERKRELFYIHEATFSTPESLIPYIIFLFYQFLRSFSLHYIFAQATTSSVRRSFSYFYFISILSRAFRCAMKNMRMFSSFFFLFKFSCQNSVFIMLLLLEPDACSTPKHVICISRVEWRFFSGW